MPFRSASSEWEPDAQPLISPLEKGGSRSASARPADVTASGSLHVYDGETAGIRRRVTAEDVEVFRNPPEGDFHKHEYTDDGSEACIKCDGVAPPEVTESSRTKMQLVLLGMAPSLTWSVMYVSVAYFRTVLGDQVLGALGLAQDVTCLVGMLLYQVVRGHISYSWAIGSSFVYKMGVCVVIPLIVYLTGKISPTVLYGMTLVNGLTTGMCQALIGSVGGIMPGQSADNLILVGSTVASLAPTSLQAALLILIPLGEGLSPKQQIYIMFPVACVGLLFSIWAQHGVLSLGELKSRIKKEQFRVRNVNKTAGKAKFVGRVARIKWYIVGEAWTWTLALFMTAVTPYIRLNAGATWEPMCATILLIVFNVLNFLGADLARRTYQWQSGNRADKPPMCSTRSSFGQFLLAVVCIGRGVLAAFVVFWIYYGPFTHDAVLVAVFAISAITNGYLTVALSNESQQLCGFHAKHLCPVVGSIIWIAMQIGVLSGIALSTLVWK